MSVLFLAVACSRFSDTLGEALELAGDNRVELEKVLDYYKNDSLKYKAARFLIENMPWHHSYGGQFMEKYVHSIDSCFASLPIELRTVLYSLPENYPELSDRLEIKPDVQTITADYLIHNIDLSFKVWRESSWLRYLYFEDFCEYLLPYRLGREPLSFWKDSLSGYFRETIRDGGENLLNASTDTYALYKFLNTHLMKDKEYFNRQFSIPEAAIGNHALDCDESSTAYAYLWRMCGIPTAVDILPRYGNGNTRHSDITFIDERLRGGMPKEPYHSVAKVYRTTFSVNRSQILQPSKDFVPEVAQNPFCKDVTASYVRTSDVVIRSATGKDKPEYLYLGVFSLGWDAIAHAPIVRGTATFKDMGVGVVYIPFYYAGNRQVFVSDPFYLDAKNT